MGNMGQGGHNMGGGTYRVEWGKQERHDGHKEGAWGYSRAMVIGIKGI